MSAAKGLFPRNTLGLDRRVCLVVSFGLGRTADVARGVPACAVRAGDRNPDGPRPAVPGLGSAGRWSAIQNNLYTAD